MKTMSKAWEPTERINKLVYAINMCIAMYSQNACLCINSMH